MQKLYIDLEVPIDCSDYSDNIENALDYSEVCKIITDYMANNSFNLIETAAERLASLLKDSFKLNKLTIAVSKPHAIDNAANIKVKITR